ncbi:MAG: hypothetical protein HDT44_10045 [Ruminococcaceae bacterium]|nr:hypothetical protein [Oscillospiraceae bacterium]
MKRFTVIGGVNGVGKSSLTGVLSRVDSSLGVIVNADDLIKIHGSSLMGGKAALGIISHCLENDLDFSQETTLSGKRVLRTIQAARNKGYHIRLFYVALNSAEESLHRIENRVKKGGHDIPTDDVVRRFQNRFQDLAKVLPYCDEVHFFDNENGFVFAGEYRNGEIVFEGKYVPQWLKDLETFLSNLP